MNRRLITSALPYVNNIPHLGNLIQMLSADVFARFCRSRGYETLYICGTDEYGTATETKALEVHKTPKELCDYYHEIHEQIYEWFGIAFDNFGRTSTPQQTEIVQAIFKDLDKNGYIKEHTSKQLYCPHCQRFLADRYVRGTCPKCGYEDARGDQCEHCGTLLDPTELINPRCSTCGATPELRETKHLYIDLPSIQKDYAKWMDQASISGKWSTNAIQMTKAWIRDGLQERAITRDLKWGIPVPKEGFENKVFYVWFDAPIGYISITKALADKLLKQGKESFDWKSWWVPSESTESVSKLPVDLFQFIGKDNIPFHTVIFPSSLIGTGRDWTKLYHMSSTEYLNYENGKFSKSKGIGVFGSDAKESGIPADAWRFYIFYNRPEKSDTQFTWSDFQEKYNGELIGNLGNLVNRTLLFVQKYYSSKIPEAPVDEDLWKQVKEHEKHITELLEWANLKDAFHEIFAISDIANKAFQAGEPWKTRTTDPEKAAKLIKNLCYVIKDLMIMAYPYIPHYAKKVMSFYHKTIKDTRIGFPESEGLTWADLGMTEGLSAISESEVYFRTLDKKTTDEFRKKFAGSQKDRKAAESTTKKTKQKKQKEIVLAVDQKEHFNNNIILKVAKIVSIERNPDSDKLYIEHLDDGSGQDRIIQSGLVPYLREDELLGKNVVIAANLKPRKMRGVESCGMLLAADYKDSEGKDAVEPVFLPNAIPGTEIVLEGSDVNCEKPAEIEADLFFQIQIKVTDYNVNIDNQKLLINGRPIIMNKTKNGIIR